MLSNSLPTAPVLPAACREPVACAWLAFFMWVALGALCVAVSCRLSCPVLSGRRDVPFSLPEHSCPSAFARHSAVRPSGAGLLRILLAVLECRTGVAHGDSQLQATGVDNCTAAARARHRTHRGESGRTRPRRGAAAVPSNPNRSFPDPTSSQVRSEVLVSGPERKCSVPRNAPRPHWQTRCSPWKGLRISQYHSNGCHCWLRTSCFFILSRATITTSTHRSTRHGDFFSRQPHYLLHLPVQDRTFTFGNPLIRSRWERCMRREANGQRTPTGRALDIRQISQKCRPTWRANALLLPLLIESIESITIGHDWLVINSARAVKRANKSSPPRDQGERRIRTEIPALPWGKWKNINL